LRVTNNFCQIILQRSHLLLQEKILPTFTSFLRFLSSVLRKEPKKGEDVLCLIYFTCHDISALPSANRRSLLHRGPTWRGMSANVTRLCVFVRVINFLYALRTSRNNAKFLIDTCQWGFFPHFPLRSYAMRLMCVCLSCQRWKTSDSFLICLPCA